MLQRHSRTRVIRQKKESDALDDADERQFDINDNRIELAAALAWRIHDATGNRSLIKMSS